MTPARVHLPEDPSEEARFRVFMDLFSDALRAEQIPVWVYWIPKDDTERYEGDPGFPEIGDAIEIESATYRVHEIDTSFRVKTFAILSMV